MVIQKSQLVAWNTKVKSIKVWNVSTGECILPWRVTKQVNSVDSTNAMEPASKCGMSYRRISTLEGHKSGHTNDVKCGSVAFLPWRVIQVMSGQSYSITMAPRLHRGPRTIASKCGMTLKQ